MSLKIHRTDLLRTGFFRILNYTMNRRSFLTVTTTALSGGIIFPGLSLHALIDTHRDICKRTLAIAADRNFASLPIGEVVVEVCKLFLGSPYVARTLEEPREERLVINLEVFDCVTLVENALALARCIKKGTKSFEAYTRELQLIRYRDGKIAGYPSRLHYFSDWIYDNEKKGIVDDITREIGDAQRLTGNINFMSANRGRYPQLANDDYFREIRRKEGILNKREYYFIPKDKFHLAENNINDGDILAFTTDIRGLDVQHTALAIRMGGRIHAIHAPYVGKSVEITGDNLIQYLASNRRMTGLMVARPLEV